MRCENQTTEFFSQSCAEVSRFQFGFLLSTPSHLNVVFSSLRTPLSKAMSARAILKVEHGENSCPHRAALYWQTTLSVFRSYRTKHPSLPWKILAKSGSAACAR